MKELKQAYILYNNYVISNWRYIVFCILLIIGISLFVTFSIQWNSEFGKVQFLNVLVGLNGEPREYALQYAFFDYFKLTWVVLLLVFFPWKVLSPISESYTVSNTLWLRLSSATDLSITIYRVLIILITTVVVASISFFWIMLFSIIQSIPISMLWEAGLAITSYVLFSGGLIISLRGKSTLPLNIRQIFVILAWIVPLSFYAFRVFFSERMHGFFPFSFPYGANELSYKTIRASFSACALGILLLIGNIFYSWIQTNFYSQNK